MEKEIDQDGRSRAAVVRRVFRSPVRAPHFAMSSCLLLAAVMGACSSDDSDPPVTDTQTQNPAPGPTTTPATMTPATPAPASTPPEPSNPTPSANEGSGDGDIPLAPGAMGGESGGQSPSGMTPAEEMPPAEETPPAEDTPPAEPPTAFNPCPTDGSPCRIMPLGDSITFGLGSTQGDGYRLDLFELAVADGHSLALVGRVQQGPNTSVQGQPFPRGNEGYSGSTINDGMNQLANRVDAAIAANPPHIVLLMIGTNDVFQQVPNPPSDLGGLLDQIIDGAPDALLVVAQIVPGQQAAYNQRVETYNSTIPELVRERAADGKHVIMVDMFTPFASSPGGANALLNDFVHPNDAGYAIMAETWYEAIEGVLP